VLLRVRSKQAIGGAAAVVAEAATEEMIDHSVIMLKTKKMI